MGGLCESQKQKNVFVDADKAIFVILSRDKGGIVLETLLSVVLKG